jgi:glycolate oxidase FAD binding subunit
MTATCAIDDCGPFPVLTPGSVAELYDIVRRAAAANQALFPLGGRTMLGYGLPPARSGLCVDLRSLNQVIDYPARDMTITVQAGITIAELQRVLARENQRLPVDVPLADQATLGGALAVNSSGPRRYGFGTLRDYVIGISAINDAGQEFKAGGRVVKNVAGYDLCKLLIGSLGTLGIITQVTLKLRPVPEERALVVLACDPPDVAALLDALHESGSRPVCIDLYNAAAVQSFPGDIARLLPHAPRLLVVGFEEKRETVAWQVQHLVKELRRGSVRGLEARVGSTADVLWQPLIDFAAWPGARLTWKANLVSSRTAELFEQAAALTDGMLLQAHAGSGIVIGHASGALTEEQARAMLTVLGRLAVAAQGNVVVLRCPPAWKAKLPVWGTPRDDLWLMRDVRDKLDPQRLFNPGRFAV